MSKKMPGLTGPPPQTENNPLSNDTSQDNEDPERISQISSTMSTVTTRHISFSPITMPSLTNEEPIPVLPVQLSDFELISNSSEDDEENKQFDEEEADDYSDYDDNSASSRNSGNTFGDGPQLVANSVFSQDLDSNLVNIPYSPISIVAQNLSNHSNDFDINVNNESLNSNTGCSRLTKVAPEPSDTKKSSNGESRKGFAIPTVYANDIERDAKGKQSIVTAHAKETCDVTSRKESLPIRVGSTGKTKVTSKRNDSKMTSEMSFSKSKVPNVLNIDMRSSNSCKEKKSVCDDKKASEDRTPLDITQKCLDQIQNKALRDKLADIERSRDIPKNAEFLREKVEKIAALRKCIVDQSDILDELKKCTDCAPNEDMLRRQERTLLTIQDSIDNLFSKPGPKERPINVGTVPSDKVCGMNGRGNTQDTAVNLLRDEKLHLRLQSQLDNLHDLAEMEVMKFKATKRLMDKARLCEDDNVKDNDEEEDDEDCDSIPKGIKVVDVPDDKHGCKTFEKVEKDNLCAKNSLTPEIKDKKVCEPKTPKDKNSCNTYDKVKKDNLCAKDSVTSETKEKKDSTLAGAIPCPQKKDSEPETPKDKNVCKTFDKVKKDDICAKDSVTSETKEKKDKKDCEPKTPKDKPPEKPGNKLKIDPKLKDIKGQLHDVSHVNPTCKTDDSSEQLNANENKNEVSKVDDRPKNYNVINRSPKDIKLHDVSNIKQLNDLSRKTEERSKNLTNSPKPADTTPYKVDDGRKIKEVNNEISNVQSNVNSMNLKIMNLNASKSDSTTHEIEGSCSRMNEVKKQIIHDVSTLIRLIKKIEAEIPEKNVQNPVTKVDIRETINDQKVEQSKDTLGNIETSIKLNNTQLKDPKSVDIENKQKPKNIKDQTVHDVAYFQQVASNLIENSNADSTESENDDDGETNDSEPCAIENDKAPNYKETTSVEKHKAINKPKITKTLQGYTLTVSTELISSNTVPIIPASTLIVNNLYKSTGKDLGKHNQSDMTPTSSIIPRTHSIPDKYESPNINVEINRITDKNEINSESYTVSVAKKLEKDKCVVDKEKKSNTSILIQKETYDILPNDKTNIDKSDTDTKDKTSQDCAKKSEKPFEPSIPSQVINVYNSREDRNNRENVEEVADKPKQPESIVKIETSDTKEEYNISKHSESEIESKSSDEVGETKIDLYINQVKIIKDNKIVDQNRNVSGQSNTKPLHVIETNPLQITIETEPPGIVERTHSKHESIPNFIITRETESNTDNKSSTLRKLVKEVHAHPVENTMRVLRSQSEGTQMPKEQESSTPDARIVNRKSNEKSAVDIKIDDRAINNKIVVNQAIDTKSNYNTAAENKTINNENDNHPASNNKTVDTQELDDKDIPSNESETEIRFSISSKSEERHDPTDIMKSLTPSLKKDVNSDVNQINDSPAVIDVENMAPVDVEQAKPLYRIIHLPPHARVNADGTITPIWSTGHDPNSNEDSFLIQVVIPDKSHSSSMEPADERADRLDAGYKEDEDQEDEQEVEKDVNDMKMEQSNENTKVRASAIIKPDIEVIPVNVKAESSNRIVKLSNEKVDNLNFRANQDNIKRNINDKLEPGNITNNSLNKIGQSSNENQSKDKVIHSPEAKQNNDIRSKQPSNENQSKVKVIQSNPEAKQNTDFRSKTDIVKEGEKDNVKVGQKDNVKEVLLIKDNDKKEAAPKTVSNVVGLENTNAEENQSGRRWKSIKKGILKHLPFYRFRGDA